VAVTIEADGIGRYPQDTEAALYFCILEALQTHPLEPFARSYCWPGCDGEATNHRVVDGLGEVIGESTAEHEPEGTGDRRPLSPGSTVAAP
jgi:hypothetical protein